MREKSFPIALFAAGVLLPCAASARPVAHHAAADRHAVAASYSKTEHHAALKRHVSAAHAPVLAHAALSHNKVAARPLVHHDTRRADPAAKRITAAAAQPLPDEAAEPAESEIRVHHNRKVHRTAEPAEAAPVASASSSSTVAAAPAEPRRVATIDDFMAPLPPVAPDPSPALSAEQPLIKAALVKPTLASPTAKPRSQPTAVAMISIAPPPATPAAVEPILYTRRGRLIVPPAMKGSHEILVHQNVMADQDGLDRVQDDDDLDRLRGGKMLVALPAGPGLQVDDRLPGNRRYCRPWTAEFLTALARAHYVRFHSSLQVNSAVRTVEFQERLRYTNGNAAPSEGTTASPHLTGQAVDLAKHGLSMTEIAWLRGYLLPLVQEGKIDVEEEFQQACFHISVYKKYMPEAAPKRVIPTRRGTATALAAALR